MVAGVEYVGVVEDVTDSERDIGDGDVQYETFSDVPFPERSDVSVVVARDAASLCRYPIKTVSDVRWTRDPFRPNRNPVVTWFSTLMLSAVGISQILWRSAAAAAVVASTEERDKSGGYSG